MQSIRTRFCEPVLSTLYTAFDPIKNKVQDVAQTIFSEIRASYALCSNRTRITAILYLCGTCAFAIFLPVSIALKVVFVASSIISFGCKYYVGLRTNIDTAYAKVVTSQVQEFKEIANELIQTNEKIIEIVVKMRRSFHTYTKATNLLHGILRSLPNVRYFKGNKNDPILTAINSYITFELKLRPAIEALKTSICYKAEYYPPLAANPTLEEVQQTQRARQEHHQKIKHLSRILLKLIHSLTECGRKTLLRIGF